MFKRREKKERQAEFWVEATRLPEATPGAFYKKVNAPLEAMGFAREVWSICAPAYADASRGGRPGIDPVVYLKMLMIGFFEDLPSERAIASRCADSLSVRGFLGYGLEEATPDHRSLSVIRQRLSLEQLESIHLVLLRALRQHGLLKGKRLGIDSSVIEANASLRALEHRNTEEGYWDYVQRLAAAAGVDVADTAAVRRFDKRREGRKTSNAEWVNPHDPEAKVGRTKDGATDMIHKPEHVNDLDSGAIISAQVLPGDLADSQEMAERVLSAVVLLQTVAPEVPAESLAQELAADEGYFSAEQVGILQECAIRTVIVDPQRRRRSAKAPQEVRATLVRARRAVQSKSGKMLLRRRGEHLERSFWHLLDHGGLRRATVCGCENLSKRHLAAALTHNLSLLLRKLFGVGTPKQFLAGGKALFLSLLSLLRALRSAPLFVSELPGKRPAPSQISPAIYRALESSTAISSSSTGC
jgi:IS5 family transposase